MCRKLVYLIFVVLLLGMVGSTSAVYVKVDFGTKSSDYDGASNTMEGFTAWKEVSGSLSVGGVDFTLSNSGMSGCSGPRKRKKVGGTSDYLTYDCISVEDQCSGTKTYTLTISNLANGDYELLTYYNVLLSDWTNSQQVKVDGVLKAGPNTAPVEVDMDNCLQHTAAFTVTGGTSQQIVVDWEEISSNGGPFICGFELVWQGALVSFESASSSGSETVSPAQIPVVLSERQAGETYMVDYAVSGGTADGGGVDYTLASGTLTFLPDSTIEYISVQIVDEGEPEGDETIVIELSNPNGPDLQLGNPTQHTFTIIDSSPAVGFDPAGGSGLEDVTPVYVAVSLSEPATETITVDYAVIGGSAEGGGVDYTFDPGTLTFYADDVTAYITIDIIADSNDEEPPETIIIELSNQTNANLGSANLYTYTILSELIHVKVDFALTECDGVTLRPGTAKSDWWLWTSPAWWDMYSHDLRWEDGTGTKPTDSGIDGTGVHAAVTLIREGDLGFKVSGLTMPSLDGGCPYGEPIYEPICNSWLQAIDWPEFEWGSIQLALHNLPAGEYRLYSYHNHFGCYRGTPVSCDCLCDVAPPMPEVRAMSCKEARELAYQQSGSWSKLFPGISWADGPWPEGVVSLQEEANVQPQQVTTDAELVPSEIRFTTDGSPVLVLYKAGCCTCDPVRPERCGGRGILNAFELIQVPGEEGPGSTPASNPRPADGANDVDPNAVLTWTPGEYVVSHDVYLGTDFQNVSDANAVMTLDVYKGRQGPNYYPVAGNLELELGTTYHWRIDEVGENDACKGTIWSFTVRGYLVVDDMESYDSTTDLRSSWKAGEWGNGAYVNLEQTTAHGGEKSMKFDYDPSFGAYFTATRLYSVGQNWTVGSVNHLSLWFYGTSSNNPDDQMYVILKDGSGHSSTVTYAGDANDIKEEEWHEWNILLQDFNDDGVILTDVREFVIGADCTVLWGTIYFDDIRLYVPRCIAEFRPAADLSGDCTVDFKDFSILGSQWQQSPGIPSADIAEPLGIVDWRDLAVLVDGWLQDGLWL